MNASEFAAALTSGGRVADSDLFAPCADAAVKAGLIAAATVQGWRQHVMAARRAMQGDAAAAWLDQRRAEYRAAIQRAKGNSHV